MVLADAGWVVYTLEIEVGIMIVVVVVFGSCCWVSWALEHEGKERATGVAPSSTCRVTSPDQQGAGMEVCTLG